jgi:hypothetical protein
MAFSTGNTIPAVKTRILGMKLGDVISLLFAISVVEGTVLVDGTGTITIGGVGLTNTQYEQLYEMLI